jgi:transcriptional regulator of acetoin/glycerol metabolism
VHVPSLRERCGDVLAWFDRLHRVWQARRPERPRGACELEVDAAQALLLAEWPDNLRGLDRLVHELAARDVDRPITAEALPAWLARDPDPSPVEARRPAPDRTELLAFLEANAYNVSAAAAHFARGRRQIYRWMEQFGIARPD